jgi:hypothetical protein
MITIALRVVWSSIWHVLTRSLLFLWTACSTRVFSSFLGRKFFLTNLFVDINVVRIFYKSSQICGTETKNDSYFENEGVNQLDLIVRASS